MTASVAVVIPFFQKEAGVLHRSLESVFAQVLPAGTRLKIIVVDDESPLPLRDELEGVQLPNGIEIVSLSRRNGGPGAARNTALDSLDASEVDFVAFLDSDDEWMPNHLSDGIAALAQDGDFYFCDHDRWYEERTWFEASETFQGWLKQRDKPFREIDSELRVSEFIQGQAFECFLRDYMAQTSTVLYRFRAISGLRFDESLRHAGEDNMFWLDLATMARHVRFSAKPNVRCGRGVNMYFSSMGWDHEDAARRVGYRTLFFLKVTSRFKPAGGARRILKDQIWFLQKTLARIAVKHLRIHRQLPIEAFRIIFREKPALMLSMPAAAVAAFSSSKWIEKA